MNHLEIEFKTLLTQKEFKSIEKQLQEVEPIVQTNYYFDTESFDLKYHKMSLRIRIFNDKAELTLKIPQAVGNFEYNHYLTVSEAERMIDTNDIHNTFWDSDLELMQPIKEAGIELTDLKLLGSLTTTRREISTKIGLMALDYNYYGGFEDYELELEVNEAEKGKRDFKAFLESNNIKFKYAKSKVARFSATLNKP
ncbi:CYTH domain-containing protein [Streptococcus macacae]|nr:CYTH domain-containing protein [Streptococcus macacae]